MSTRNQAGVAAGLLFVGIGFVFLAAVLAVGPIAFVPAGLFFVVGVAVGASSEGKPNQVADGGGGDETPRTGNAEALTGLPLLVGILAILLMLFAFFAVLAMTGIV